MWDTYGFDYDTERSYGGVLYAWAYGVTEEELAENLRADGIEFTTFPVDTVAWFGLPNGLPPS